MYEMTSYPLVRRTLATLRRAEFGFLGVVVYTRVHTPRRCGQFSSAGLLLPGRLTARGLRRSWLIVGMTLTRPLTYCYFTDYVFLMTDTDPDCGSAWRPDHPWGDACGRF